MHEQTPETHPTGRTGQGPAVVPHGATISVDIVDIPNFWSPGISSVSPIVDQKLAGQGPIDGPMQGFRAGPVPGTHQTEDRSVTVGRPPNCLMKCRELP